MADDASTVTVGVLGLHSSKESKAILNAIDALGHDAESIAELRERGAIPEE